MLGTILSTPVTAFTAKAVLNHYAVADAVSWHVEFTFGRIGDPLIAAPIANMTVDSSSVQTDWYYRLEGVGVATASRVLAAIPAGGIASSLASLDTNKRDCATVHYRFTSLPVLAALTYGEELWQRMRQWDGSAWGDYATKLIRVGLE